ncbi:hypothetical protein V5P93_003958 [Actinokineospora auranticolor]|uniref:Uncharacterized protein n=1 Tax=Actinokineospora auranticolor TaxID=155976 RepID=A0A2S6GM34_9PSEU|nr:hypothetical protein [Actinokineospora auranticolor]PPK66240.1 hypothetical protein CLV40_111204 [Actinokineospora auranticolor]
MTAGRKNLVDTDEQRTSFLGGAHNIIRAAEALQPDVTADDDTVLTSLCRFDFYVSLVSIDQHGPSISSYYPNFARYLGRRTPPAALAVITDPVLRHQLFPGADHHLAEALRDIDQYARTQSFHFDGWNGYDERVYEWITRHLGDTGTKN